MPLLSPAIQRAAQRPWVAAALIVVAIALCYSNSLSAEFFFDDLEAIVRNPTIRSLSPLSRVLVTPPGSSVGARPLVNLSFALNYAVGELDVRGYRLVNIAIHMTTALLLFGLVRRTLLLPRVAAKYDLPALPVATAVAMLWAVHPLHTEVVTYVTHRNECLMGMLLLACLYCVRRSVDARRPRAWHAAAVVACFAGAASKEVMAVAPLIVLLYDRTFLAGTFAVALRKRRGLYVALASSWFLLGVLVAGTHGRGGAAGYGLSVRLWEYLTTQAWAIVHYLRLAVWPAPLVVDYGALIVDDPRQWLVPGVAVLLLLSLTGYLLIRKPVVGFLGRGSSSSLRPVRALCRWSRRPSPKSACTCRWRLLSCSGFARAAGFCASSSIVVRPTETPR